MTDVHVDAVAHCRGCGNELKPSALFCTGCGARLEDEIDAPDGATCGACGVVLKDGAEFCTQCGTAIVHEAKTDTPTPKERISPAASRAILGSVTGGMGSYVGKSTAAGGDKTPPSLARTPEEDHRRRKLLIAAIIAVVLGLLAGIGAIIATQGNDGASLRAGGGHSSSVAGVNSGGSKNSSTTSGTRHSSGSGSTKGSSSDGSNGSSGTSDSGSDSTTGTDSSTGSQSSDSSSSGGGQSSGGTSYSGGGSSGGSVAPPVPPAHFSLSSTNLSVSDTSGDSVTIRNTGGRSGGWSISGASTGSLGGSLNFDDTSGYLAPGSSVTVSVTWSGGNEGTTTGGFNVNGGGGPYQVSVGLDSTFSDSVYTVNACGSRCSNSGAALLIQMVIGPSSGFNYTVPDKICFQVTNGSNGATQCYSVYDWAFPVAHDVGRSLVWVNGTGYVMRIQVPVKWNTVIPNATVINVWDQNNGTNLGETDGVVVRP